MKYLQTSAALVLAATLSQPLIANVTHSVGIARNASDNTIQYVEHHQYLPSGDHLITYFDQGGIVLATKAITYPGLPQHPEINQSDFTRNLSVKAYAIEQTLHMTRSEAGKEEAFVIPLDESTIVDAGFDHFLRDNWQTFDEGTPRSFKFAVAGQKRVLNVEITKKSTTSEATAFTIRPRNVFIRLLVPEIRLLYSQDQRLLAYDGLTNLNLPAEQSRSVSIEFNHYSSSNKLSKPLTQWLPDK